MDVRLVGLTLVALTFPDILPVLAGTTLYVNKFFEVRDHEQPTKYIFSGDTRVARVTGSLSTHTRIQRLRLRPGWNLVSLAIAAPNTLRQMTNSQFSILNSQSIFHWNQPARTWLPISPNDTLPAGTVLWLHATTNITLALTGTYTDPTNRPIATGGSFQHSAGLEALPLLGERAGVRADLPLWHFDSSIQNWQMHLPSIPSSDPGFPEFLAPGQALFVKAEAPAELEVPDATLRIRYYHHDHLGSSSVMTDADGALVEETAFYPFGLPRHEHRLRQVEERYKFTQKERDRESGLHYFEARYLASPTGRFLSVDPKYANLDGFSGDDLKGFLVQPQENNLYSYAGNNPLKYTDPTGFERGIVDAIFAPIGDPDYEIDWKATAEWPIRATLNAIGDIIGINTANAPGPGDKTYPSLSYEEHAKNIVVNVGGGKLVKHVGGKIFGGTGSSAPAAVPKVAPPAKSAIDPFAKTGVDPLAKTAPAGGGGVTVSSQSGAARAASAQEAQMAAHNTHVLNRITAAQAAGQQVPYAVPPEMVQRFIKEADELFGDISKFLD